MVRGFAWFLAIFVSAVGQAQAQQIELVEPLSSGPLIVTCTSNLRAVYAEPVAERRLIGAEFIDRNRGPETLSACEGLVALEPEPTHLLWLAYAELALGDHGAAIQVLGRIPPAPKGTYGLIDPRVRAGELRRALAALPAPIQAREFSYFSPLAQPPYAFPNAVINLAQEGHISEEQLLAHLQESGAYFSLLDIYQGLVDAGPDGARLGPDLLALRAMSDEMREADDTLVSIWGHVRGSALYGRGYGAQGVEADLEAAQDRIDAAFMTGFRAWFDLSQPEAYRDDLIAQVAPLAFRILQDSQDPEALELLVQAVDVDWDGLQSTQGLSLLAAIDQAALMGSPLAEAQQLIAGLFGEAESEPTEVLQQLEVLAGQDACVYDIWAETLASGFFGEADLEQARDLFRAAQASGKVAGFVGEANMLRWGVLETGYDFKTARDLYQQSLEFEGAGECGQGDYSSALLQLGWMFFTGQGGEQDMTRALQLFYRAMQRGNFAAAETLADMYFFGLGVPQDLVLANDMATKAYLWNGNENLQWVVQALHQKLVGPFEEFDLETPGGLPILPEDIALAELWEAANRGNFYGLYYLGLVAMADPDLTAELGIPWKGSAYIQELDSHVGFFERGFVEGGSVREQWFDEVRRELEGQVNLTFTSARHDTVAGIAHDPVRAFTFYRAIADENLTAQKLLDMDRFPYLTEQGKGLAVEGPLRLEDVIAFGLEEELRPLPLHLLLMP